VFDVFPVAEYVELVDRATSVRIFLAQERKDQLWKLFCWNVDPEFIVVIAPGNDELVPVHKR
jgi:hypothetical protein